MGDNIPHYRGGHEAPESPLVFSVPTSLQEYMSSRHMEIPAERAPPPPLGATPSPEPVSVRHRFDSGIINNFTDARPASASPPGRSATTAHQHHADHRSSATLESARGPGRPLRSDYLAAWRAISERPHPGPVESVQEHQGQHSTRQRFGAHRSEADPDNGEGRMGRRRVQAHSSSRGGRPQSSTAARRSGGGLSGGWSGGGAGQVSLSPMNVAARERVSDDNGGNSGAPHGASGQWSATYQAHEDALLGGNPAGSEWRGRRLPPAPYGDTLDEGIHPSRGGGGVAAQANRGRRSLSDFLREIEDMVRAQREQRDDLEIVSPRTRAAPHPHQSTRSRPLAAAAAAMAAAASHHRQMSGTYGRHVDNGSAHIPGSVRYVPPGGRVLSQPAGDSQSLRQRLAGANNIAGMAAAPSSHLRDHHNVYERSEWNHTPFTRSPGLSPNVTNSAHPPMPGYGIPTLAIAAAAVAAARETRSEAADTETGASAPGRWPRSTVRDPLNPPFQLSAAATAFSMSTHGNRPIGLRHDEEPGASNGGVSAEDLARQQGSDPSRPWHTAIMRRMAEPAPRGIPAGNSGGEGHVHRDGAIFSSGATTRAETTAAVTAIAAHLQRGETDPSLVSNGVGIDQEGRMQQESRSTELQVVPLSRMVTLPPEGTAATMGVEAGVRPDEARQDGQDNNPSQSNRAALPVFRHWESQRARLRIQWHEQVLPESPASDGTLVLTEGLSPSNGPSPQARGRGGFGRYGGARLGTGSLGSLGSFGGGGGNDNASKVEEALFSCLMSLGVRRLLLERGSGETSAGAGNRRR
ncbi:unnamed protein product, partial [Hapterophycus canaliculatus]